MNTGFSRSTRMPVSASTFSSCRCFAAFSRRRSAFPQLAPLDDVRVEDVTGCGEEPMPILERQVAEQAAVSNDRFEHLDRLPQAGGVPVLLRFRHGPEGSRAAR